MGNPPGVGVRKQAVKQYRSIEGVLGAERRSTPNSVLENRTRSWISWNNTLLEFQLLSNDVVDGTLKEIFPWGNVKAVVLLVLFLLLVLLFYESRFVLITRL